MITNSCTFLKGKKTGLRALSVEDASTLLGFVNNPENLQYLKRRLPLTLDDERKWIEALPKRAPESFTFGIVRIEEDDLIGVISLGKIDYFDRRALTGTIIGRTDLQGQGYGTDAKMTLLEWAFETLNLRKIYSKVWAFNGRSLAYAAKCGYQVEARLKNYAWKNSQYVDEIILAVEREDFLKARGLREANSAS